MQFKLIVSFALALATQAGASILQRQIQECCIPAKYACTPVPPNPPYPPPFPPQGCCLGLVCQPNPVLPQQFGTCLPPAA
ncbi:hypothetical protein DFH08DRAFT_969954 [Mycena albidolilacea]|uniref:Uncharacterized protein n=1 Tax=Mycena albidolilacea TaxID=1033008 RepID=A0AAD6ZH32_9AGAR|nr:hypothetical protein DFH08DRAFT_969954 [Mycena albidolilacea]